MKRTIAFIAFFVASSFVMASEPIKSRDVLEKDLIACLMGKPKESKCITNILGNKLIPGNESVVAVANQMDDLLIKWLGNENIYAVHFIKSVKAGDVTEKRIYLIEDSIGNFMAMTVVTIKHLGKLYTYKFHLSSTDEKLEEVLNPSN